MHGARRSIFQVRQAEIEIFTMRPNKALQPIPASPEAACDNSRTRKKDVEAIAKQILPNLATS